jgi:hypothetical protein
MVLTSGRGANRLNKKEAAPVGIKGTCAGKEVRGVLAASGVGGDILKEIIMLNGSGYILKRMEVTVIFQRPWKGRRGSMGGVHRSGTGANKKGGKHALRVERSGGWRSGVSEGTPWDWGGRG